MEVMKAILSGLSKKTTWVALAAALLTATLGILTAETQMSVINPISEEIVFDPLCVGNHNLNFGRSSFCEKPSWVEFMGASANIDIEKTNDNHARILFLKIDVSDVPQPLGPFSTTIISKAQIVLKTRYDPAINGTVNQIPFYTMSQMCYLTDWSQTTADNKLPCINNQNFHPDGKFPTFDSFNPEWIDDVVFDIKPHVEKARELDLDMFTELIQFYPIEISNNNGFDKKTTECIKKKSDENLSYTELDECLKKYRISVYSNENPSTGVRPQIILEYTTKPSTITTPLIAVGAAAIPLFSGIIQAQYKAIGEKRNAIIKKKNEDNAKMNRICDSLEEEIEDTLSGLENGVGDIKPIKSIDVEFDADYLPINFKLEKYVSRVILFTDAYTGILNSGSFENFEKNNQIEISTVYNLIAEHNKILELYFRTIENARLMVRPETEMTRFQKGLIMNLENYLIQLGELREKIMSRIQDPNNGIISIIKTEKEKYQK